jgi:hypothetical protein
MSKSASFDPSRRLDIYLRIDRVNSRVLAFFQDDGSEFSLIYEDFEVFISRYAGDRVKMVNLTIGSGLTISDNKLYISLTEDQSNVNEGEYYWELYRPDTGQTWLNGYALFHNGEFDGVNPIEPIVIGSENPVTITIDQPIQIGGGTENAVQSVTGDGVNNADPQNPVLSYPSPSDIGAATNGDVSFVAGVLSDHINDATAAHAASAISFAPSGPISSTDVQGAILEVANEVVPSWPLTGSATLNAPVLNGSYATLQRDNIGATPLENTGIRLENNTAVTTGTPVTTQVSPAITLKANGWASSSGSSRPVEFLIVNTPVAGTSNPNGYLLIRSSVNEGAYQDVMRVNNAGNLEVFGTGAFSMPLGSGTEVLTITGASKQFSVTQEGLVTLHTVGSGLRIKEGTNASMGVATLAAGTVTVNNTRVTANSRIFLTVHTPGGTQGFLSHSISAATSFTINSTSVTETSTVNWLIIEPAP